MKQIIITILLVLALTGWAKDTTKKEVLGKTKNSITFVVDKGLKPIKDEPLHYLLCDGKTIARYLVSKEGIIGDSLNMLALSFADEKSMHYMEKDAFYQTIKYAYKKHKGLVLSPDMIWMSISQGFARYVNAHPEELRQQLVNHEGQMDLVVQTNQEARKDWEQMVNEFANEIAKYTKEAIAHAQAANVPMVFAINKIDKPGANPDKIRQDLAAMNLLVEEWGGKYQCQEISAKKGTGVAELLEKVLLEAEMLDLKANPNRKATGSVIEASLDKGRGYVATMLVSNGTLKMGAIVIAGTYYGRVKAIFNERNQRIDNVRPAEPAIILGLNGAPSAGDSFHIMETEQEARDIANKRLQLQREQSLRTTKVVGLEEIAHRIALGEFHVLNLIVKADTQGSVEALSDSFIKLSTEKIQVNVLQGAVGQISENDVMLASAAENSIIIGFNVRPSAAAKKVAEQHGVEINTYSVIYDAIDDITSVMEGMLDKVKKEVVTGQVEVREVYKISKVGTVAGAMVVEGKVHRTDKARVIRDGIVVHTAEINALKRFKDDVKEVATNFECGISLVNFNDIQQGDILETFTEIEVKQTL